MDLLRGVAALGVLLGHWKDAFFVDYNDAGSHSLFLRIFYGAAGLGHQWVIVFFVMSGFLVGGSVLRAKETGRWSWRIYLLTRLTRLYIVLMPALLLGGVLDWAGMHVHGSEGIYRGQSGMHALSSDVHLSLTAESFAANTAFLQTISLPGMKGKALTTFGSNGPLWSLSNEFWYYLAFPVLLNLIGGRRSLFARSACAVALLLWGWFVGSGIALLGVTWLLGVSLSLLPGPRWRGRWAGMLAIAVTTVCSGSFARYRSRAVDMGHSSLWNRSSAAGVYTRCSAQCPEFVYNLPGAFPDVDFSQGNSASSPRCPRMAHVAGECRSACSHSGLCADCVRSIRKEYGSFTQLDKTVCNWSNNALGSYGAYVLHERLEHKAGVTGETQGLDDENPDF
jgi:peptidoglycan/LPS O-acetylase OafA/YrhL